MIRWVAGAWARVPDDVRWFGLRTFLFVVCLSLPIWAVHDEKNDIYIDLFVACFLSAILLLVPLYFHQDYLGEGRHRFAKLRSEFGGRYRFSFVMCGHLSVRALEENAVSLDGAIEFGKALWIEPDGRLRDNITQKIVFILDHGGRHQCSLVLGYQPDGARCMFVVPSIATGFTFRPEDILRSHRIGSA